MSSSFARRLPPRCTYFLHRATLKMGALFQSTFRRGVADKDVSLTLCNNSDSAWGHVDEVFAFDRTVSRLTEMRSEEYLAQPWTPDVDLSGVGPTEDWDLSA